MDRHDRFQGPSRVSPKLDGVNATATKSGIRTKSGKPLDLPKLEKRLRRHFKKRPDSKLEGELWRRGRDVGEISAQARKGGKAASGLKLHVFPDQGKRPLPIGAVRRVKAKTATSEGDVRKLMRRSLRKGHEGVVVQGPDGKRRKLKPQADAEYPVEAVQGGPKGVLVLGGGKAGRFKAQSGKGVSAKPGDRVEVRYSGMTRRGVPKAAVARRVRNDNDFSTMTEQPFDTPFRRLIELRGLTEEEEIAQDRRRLAQIGATAVGGGAVAAGILAKGRGKTKTPAEAVAEKKVRKRTKSLLKKNLITKGEAGRRIAKAGKLGKAIRKAPGIPRVLRHFEEKRDGLSKARDAAIIGAAGAGGAGALAAGKAAKKTADAVSYASGSVARAARRVDSKSVAEEGAKILKKGAKKKIKKLFPTFTKAAKAASKHVFETPAQRILVEFAMTRDQLREIHTKEWADPWKVASGVQRAGRPGKNGQLIEEDLPIGNMQVIRAARRKAGNINKWGGRAGRVVKDAGDVITGKPRQRDASGRKKKREWEKQWAKNEAGKAAVTAGLLGYGTALKKSPGFRAANVRAVKKVKTIANRLIPDTFPDLARKAFDTPGARLIELARKDDRKASPVVAGATGAAAGGVGGAVIGADTARSSKAAGDLNDARVKNTTAKVKASLSRAGEKWKGKGASAKPFGTGKFTQAERLARAEHQAANRFLKTSKRRMIKGGVIGAAVLGGLNYAAAKAQQKKRNFATPAQRILVELDAAASDAGWDVRDPRGKSARVFAPGSRKRTRRKKKWHEEIDNERKLRNAGTVAALVTGAAAGALGMKAVARRQASKAAKRAKLRTLPDPTPRKTG